MSYEDEPVIHNGDQITVNALDGTTQRYVVESGGFDPGVIPLYRVGKQELTCRVVPEETDDHR